jgi:hypothetical protein
VQSLESIPTWFSDFFDITLESGQVILSIFVILAVLLPIMYVSRNRRGFVIELIMIFLTEGVLVGIGWLPFWLLIATVALVAFGVATLGTNAVVGR